MSRNGKRKGKTTAKQKLSTRQLMNTRRTTEYSLETYDEDELVYLIIRPISLSVLSESSIRARVYALMNVLRDVAEIEVLCLSSRGNFEENKEFLCRRAEEECNPTIRQLLEWDQIFLDWVQVQMATAHEFLALIRLRNRKGRDVFSYLDRTEKSLEEQGFDFKRADEKSIKRILVAYHKQDVISEKFEGFDGVRWIISDD